jgi:hypothetical protein
MLGLSGPSLVLPGIVHDTDEGNSCSIDHSIGKGRG